MIYRRDGYYIIEPSGTYDDTALIQAALDRLGKGDTLRLNGDFVIRRTIYLPSNIFWVLNGTLTLGDNAVLDQIGVCGSGYDCRKPTAITEKPGGATNINMSGGTYYKNTQKIGSKDVRFIYFSRVSNSRFRNMTIKNNSEEDFTFGPLSTQNECLILVSQVNQPNQESNTGTWYCTSK